MIEERLQDISVVYYLRDNLDSSVKVVDGFPAEPLKEEDLPIVAVENRRFIFDNFQLGSEDVISTREWIVYIYAKNKTQRDNLLYTIGELLQKKVPVYDYNQGFPPQVNPDQIGALNPDRIAGVVVQIDSELAKTLFYRAEVHYRANYMKII